MGSPLRGRVREGGDRKTSYFRGRVNSPLPPLFGKEGGKKDPGPEIESAGEFFAA